MVEGAVGGVDGDFRVVGGFVGGVDAGEVGDFAGAGAAVEVFGIALFADVEGGADEDFDEAAGGYEGTGEGALGAEGGDAGDEGDESGVVQEGGGVGDAADVFVAVGVAEV